MIMHSGTNKWDNLGFIMNWPSIGRLKKNWQRRSIINDGCSCEHGNNLGGCGHPTLLKILKDGFLNEYAYDHMGGSWNRGTPSHYPFRTMVFSLINHPSGGTPFMETIWTPMKIWGYDRRRIVGWSTSGFFWFLMILDGRSWRSISWNKTKAQ